MATDKTVDNQNTGGSNTSNQGGSTDNNKPKSVSFKNSLKKALGISNSEPKILLLVIFLLCLVFFVLLLISYGVFKKLDDNTQYLITGESEHISYHTSENLPPDIIIRNFQFSQECGEFSEKVYSEGELNVSPNYIFKFTRMVDDEVIITVVKAPSDKKKISRSSDSEKGFFEAESEEFTYDNCLLIKINLDDKNPIFEFNAVGNVELGKKITDAQDGYFPLVLSGDISVTGKTIFSGTPYQFSPYTIKKSDYIYSKSIEEVQPSKKAKPTDEEDKKNDFTQTAIVRAFKGEVGLTGIVAIKGRRLYVQRYRMTAQAIESSFIDRISNDYELAFSLSIALVFIQFTFGLVNFLLRIELID